MTLEQQGRGRRAELPGVAYDPNTTARLYAIIARARRRAVVFRRGPRKLVRLLVWELDSDTLVGGQWLKGRIYERDCHLSPDGELLAYFAGNRSPLGTWTAISRPPYLTALALWPMGDRWGGGAFFARSDLLDLHHPDRRLQLADGFKLPPGLQVRKNEVHLPIEHRRLMERGWTIDEDGPPKNYGLRSLYFQSYDPPRRSQRPVGQRATLAVLLHALGEKQGRQHVLTAVIEQGDARRGLGRVDWADADHTGDVLYAANGCLYRIAASSLLESDPVLVADLNGMSFEPMVAPPEAMLW